MKFQVRREGGAPVNVAFVILLGYALGLLLYVALIRFASFPDSIAAVESLKASPYGLGVGSYSIGYLSIFILALSALLSLLWRKGRAWFSWTGAAAALALGVVLGSSFGAASASIPSNSLPYGIQDSGQGFTLTVSYGSTTLTLGKNLTMRYTLTDDSYTLTTPYYLFGGQFSMVFFNSTGKQTVAFRAPITFNRGANQYLVQLQPGETWSTLLQWDGLIIPVNGSIHDAAPGAYTLESYAVIQDANVSLYVVLHPPTLPVLVVGG